MAHLNDRNLFYCFGGILYFSDLIGRNESVVTSSLGFFKKQKPLLQTKEDESVNTSTLATVKKES